MPKNHYCASETRALPLRPPLDATLSLMLRLTPSHPTLLSSPSHRPSKPCSPLLTQYSTSASVITLRQAATQACFGLLPLDTFIAHLFPRLNDLKSSSDPSFMLEIYSILILDPTSTSTLCVLTACGPGFARSLKSCFRPFPELNISYSWRSFAPSTWMLALSPSRAQWSWRSLARIPNLSVAPRSLTPSNCHRTIVLWSKYTRRNNALKSEDSNAAKVPSPSRGATRRTKPNGLEQLLWRSTGGQHSVLCFTMTSMPPRIDTQQRSRLESKVRRAELKQESEGRRWEGRASKGLLTEATRLRTRVTLFGSLFLCLSANVPTVSQ